MGLIFNRKKKKNPETIDFKISTSIRVTTPVLSEKEKWYIDNGYQEWDWEYYDPDTVWLAGRNGKTYHSSPYCNSYIKFTDPIPLPECEAVRRKLKRCKRCQWKSEPPPPCLFPKKSKIRYIHDTSKDKIDR